MNWLAIFGAGLLAGATTCAVAQGGLLVGLISRQKKAAVAAGVVPSGQPSSATDDVFPVAGFLAGKFVVLVAAGVLLGSVGSILAPDTRIGGGAMLVAAMVMVVFGLSTLGVPGFRAIVIAPPAAWTRVVRKSTRSQSAFAPFMLGLATLLIPCGVTISMMLLATTSGSAAAGGMVMAVFVLGTAPMFAAYGFVTQRYLSKGSRGMSIALGSVVVVMGLFALNSGLVVLASPVTAQSIVASVVGRSAAAETTLPAPGLIDGVQVLRINATSNGYAPTRLAATAGVPTRIVIHTENTRSCIVYTVFPTLGKQATLPESGDTSLDLGRLTAGEIPIACSMGMFVGTIVVT